MPVLQIIKVPLRKGLALELSDPDFRTTGVPGYHPCELLAQDLRSDGFKRAMTAVARGLNELNIFLCKYDGHHLRIQPEHVYQLCVCSVEFGRGRRPVRGL